MGRREGDDRCGGEKVMIDGGGEKVMIERR